MHYLRLPPKEAAKHAQLRADTAAMLAVDPHTGQGRFTTGEILDAMVEKYPWWKEEELNRHGTWGAARDWMVRWIRNTKVRLLKRGFVVAYREDMRPGIKTFKTDMPSSVILAWFRVQKNVDNLSWKEKEEIIHTLGIP